MYECEPGKFAEPGSQEFLTAIGVIVTALTDADLEGDTISPESLKALKSAQKIARIVYQEALAAYEAENGGGDE